MKQIRKFLFILVLFGSFLSLQAQSESKFKPDYLKPRFKDFDVPFMEFSFDAAKCATLLYTSGTVICIPPQSLVDKDGNIHSGETFLYYRELHTPYEIFISGANMQAKAKSGKNAQLNSAGMFDIRAFDLNGNELFINPTSKIDIRMASFQKALDGVSAYKYNEKDGIWEGKALYFSVQKPMPMEGKYYPDLYGDVIKSKNDNLSNNFQDNQNSEFGDWGFGDDFYEEDPEYTEFNKFANEVYYNLGIKEFGFYNYDAIMKEGNAVQIIADFKFQNTIPDGGIVEIIVVYEKFNTVYTFPSYTWKDKFYLLDGESYKMFAIIQGKKLEVMPKDKIAALNLKSLQKKKHTFELEEIPQETNSPYQLKSALGFN